LIANDTDAAISKTYSAAARLIASTLYYQQHHNAIEVVITED